MPLNPQQALFRANAAMAAGGHAEAEILYREIIKSHPDFHPAYHGLGLIAYHAGKLEIAVNLMNSAITLAPDTSVYNRDKGEMLRRLGRCKEAVECARAAVALAPEVPEGHYNLGLALADDEQSEAAVAAYRKAVSLNPQYGLAFNNMGTLLETLGEIDAAELAYRRAVTLNPDHAEAQNNLGALLSKSGAIDEGRACLERAVTADPRSISAHFNLAPLKRYTGHDPDLVMLEKLARDTANLDREQRIQLLFALGKAHDDAGNHAAAFAAFQQGNDLKAQEYATVNARGEPLVRAIREQFSASFLESARTYAAVDADQDPTPVFIVGMPRSGTSLIEQILASHPAVHGAGELKDFHKITLQTVGQAYPHRSREMRAESIAELGRLYMEELRGLAPGAACITDKMPGNFHYLGLIYLALPNARVIHSVRDPMDSCVSCYTKLFKDAMDFTYKLETLGDYYVRYAETMGHWQQVLAEPFLLNLHYEHLVADLEGAIRKMLEHLGLPWDDACLAFHHNQRPVRTASMAQVRKPIYRSSVGAWTRFEEQVTPLLQVVGRYRAEQFTE